MFLHLARSATVEADSYGFTSDTRLINRYIPGACMSLHQDKGEQDYGAPTILVSLGMSTASLFGEHRRADRP